MLSKNIQWQIRNRMNVTKKKAYIHSKQTRIHKEEERRKSQREEKYLLFLD